MTSHAGLLGHTWEHWHWDVEGKSTAVQLSSCQQAVYFHTNMLMESEGSAGVRGTKGKVTTYSLGCYAVLGKLV